MIPIKGQYRDTDELNQPEGFSRKLLNAVISKTNGNPTNEYGFDIHSESFVGYTLVGYPINIGDGRKVLFSIKDSNSISEIGVLDKDGNYTTKVADTSLGFNIDYPITGEVSRNYKNQILVAFTDGNKSPKLLNLDDIAIPFNINNIELFPQNKEVKVSGTVEDSGGNCLTGAYFVSFKYKNLDGTETNATSINGPYYVNEDTISEGYNNYDGAKAKTPSPKSILFNLENIDTNYDKIVLLIVYKADGVLEAKEVKELSIGNSSMQIRYSGEDGKALSLIDILTPTAFYKSIKHLTQTEGILYGAGVKESNPVNFQKYALKIKLKWKSELVNQLDNLDTSHKNVNIASNKRGFWHGEVYAFYISLKPIGEDWTKAFIIPGRASGNVPDLPNVVENQLNYGNFPYASFLSKDIDIASDSRFFHFRDTTRNINNSNKTGDFGYYENSDEEYPDTEDFDATSIGGLNLRGKKVRHHRFPSLSALANSLYNGNNNYMKSEFDILSLYVDQIEIPIELQSKIEGYKILYAKRTPNNSTVVSQDILLLGAYRRDSGEGSEKYTSGGNFNSYYYNSNSKTSYPNDGMVPNSKSLRFHSFDLLSNKPSVNVSYIETFVKLKRSGLQSPPYILDDGDGNPSNRWAYRIDYRTSQDRTAFTKYAPLYKVKDFKYVPANTISGNINNSYGEEVATSEIIGAGVSLTVSSLIPDLGQGEHNNPLSFEETLLTNLMSYNKNVYNGFSTQELISTNKFILVSDTPNTIDIYGGDCFISYYSFVTYGLNRVKGDKSISDATNRILREFIVESNSNLNLRYEEPSKQYSKYYPKSEASVIDNYYFKDYPWEVNPNQFEYNKDYSSLNDLNAIIPYNTYEQFVEEHANRIIRCKGATNDNKVISWKTFLANDYFELQTNRGIITNIKGSSEGLIINTEYSIFKTRGKEELATDEFKVRLGNGDIFQYPPQELIFDDNGYAGCQHKFSCLLTPNGYIFFDENKSEIFLLTESPIPITTGLRNFINENKSITGDNPFKGQGYTLAWDEEFKRLIFTKIGVYTFAYSFDLKSWYCEHSYRPDLLFNDRNTLFSYKLANKRIYKHNIEGKFGIYYDNTINNFEIIAVFNQEREVQKNFFSLNWLTHVFKPNGSLERDITFTGISLWDRYQATSLIEIKPYILDASLEDNFDNANTRRKKNEWFFNKFKDWVINYENLIVEDYTVIDSNIDKNKDFFLQKPFVDNFIVVRFVYNNKKINDIQYQIRVDNLDIEYKHIK